MTTSAGGGETYKMNVWRPLNRRGLEPKGFLHKNLAMCRLTQLNNNILIPLPAPVGVSGFMSSDAAAVGVTVR